MSNVEISLNQNATYVTVAMENFGTKDEAGTEMIDPEPGIPFRSSTLQNICKNTDYLGNVFWRWPSSGPGLDNLSEGACPNCLQISKESYCMPMRMLKSKIRSL